MSEPTVTISRKDHVVFIIVTLLYWASLYAYVPVLPEYLEARGLSISLIGTVLGSYGFTQIVVRLPLGIASDKLRRRKPFILLGMLTASASCLLFPLAGTWGIPLLARVVSGISASTWVAFTVLYSGYFALEDTAKAMGSISFMTVVGQLMGMTISGWTADRWGYGTMFATGAALSLAGLTAAFLVKEPRDGVARESIRVRDLAGVARSPLLLAVSGLSIMAHGILFITMFGFTPLQAVRLGASKTELTLLVVAFMVPHAFASLVGGKRIAPRFGIWRTIGVGFSVSALCTFLIPQVSSFGWLVVTQAFNGFAQGMHLPLLLGLSIRDFEPSKRATAMGFYQAVYSVGMFAGPFVAGWLNESYGLASGFYMGGSIGITAAVLTLCGAAGQNKRLRYIGHANGMK